MTPSRSVPRPAGLPAEPDTFIGRERDLAELRELLRTARAVTLCAPGGMGKTRLAVHLALEIADGYPDGAWLVELAGLNRGDLVVTRLAERLGIVEEPGRDLVDTVADALHARTMLLVLDNCEHLIDAAAELAARLLRSCPRVTVLATSREPLHVPGETIWRVPPLALPPGDEADPARHEAVRLFADRAAAVQRAFRVTEATGPDVVRLCQALDGMPLAIELAAARVSVLTPREIAERLGDRFRLLTTGDRTAPERQRTLRAVVDWSHELLGPQEQILFRRLSVFAGTWTLDEAERVCADGDLRAEAILDVLAALVDKSLVLQEPIPDGTSGYRMLETIRGYAADRLRAAGERERLGRAMRDVVLADSERMMEIALGAGAAEALPDDPFVTPDRARPNIRAALEWCRDQGESGAGLRLTLAASVPEGARGRFAELSGWFGTFLDQPGDDPGVPEWLRGRGLAFRAQMALDLGDAEAARRYAEQALEPTRSARDVRGHSAACFVIGMLRLRAGHPGAAAEVLLDGLRMPGAEDDIYPAAMLHLGLAAVAMAEGRTDDADASLRAADEQVRRSGLGFGRSKVLIGKGISAQLRGDLAEARSCFEESLPWLRASGSTPELTRGLISLARLAVAEEAPGEALVRVREALRLAHSTGQRLAVARAVEVAAQVAVLQRDHPRAARLAGAVAALREAAGAAPTTGRFEELLAPARTALGADAVETLYKEGHTLDVEAAVRLATTSPTDPAPAPAPAPGPAPAAGAVPEPRLPVAEPDAPLTPREREIVTLITRGLSNRAIADELTISPATAARHVANILAKLGFTSRSQVAAWAARNPD